MFYGESWTWAVDNPTSPGRSMVSTVGSQPQKYAPQVCVNCHERKKRCDKVLPICGHCSRRSLLCHYKPVARISRGDSRRRGSTGHSSPYQTIKPFPERIGQSRIYGEQVAPKVRSNVPLLDTILNAVPLLSIPEDDKASLGTIDVLVSSQVSRIINTTGEPLEKIIERFSTGVHSWLPVISKCLLLDSLRSQRDPPKPDLSLLLLAMTLLTLDPTDMAKRRLQPDTLYIVVKMLFAQVQASVTLSTQLAQASLLIAAYEYASGRIDTACQTIGSTARIVYALGLPKSRSLLGQLREAYIKTEEQRSLWWGIVIFERLLACEVNTPSVPMATDFPASDSDVPVEIGLLDQIDDMIPKHISTPRITDTAASNVGSFGRQAQASFLLDQVLKTFKIEDIRDRQLRLLKLDSDVQSVLRFVMQQCYGVWGMFCGAIATSLRVIYSIHLHISEQIPAIEWLPEFQASSQLTLETMTKIVVDIARSHQQNASPATIDATPPTMIYLMQAALKYLDSCSKQGVPKEELFENVEVLRVGLEMFKRRWYSVMV